MSLGNRFEFPRFFLKLPSLPVLECTVSVTGQPVFLLQEEDPTEINAAKKKKTVILMVLFIGVNISKT